MALTVSSPVTGGPQTGFTSPTYTLVTDTAPDGIGKQYAVSALGGTQAGVTVHSVASPFTVMGTKPRNLAVLGKPNLQGVITKVDRNTYKVVVRKGMLPLVGQPYQVGLVRVEMQIPAGCDAADPANVRAMLSLAFGTLWQISAGVGDTTVSGII